MAGQQGASAGAAGPPATGQDFAGSQAAPGGLPRGFAGFWTPLFGPPFRPGGPPRTIWVPASQLLVGG
eukprot:2842861-Alexandrium_andersonii.AAC.1